MSKGAALLGQFGMADVLAPPAFEKKGSTDDVRISPARSPSRLGAS